MRGVELVTGRVFVLRLEEGEILHEAIESFCTEHGIAGAAVSMTGAVAPGSIMVSGPATPVGDRIEPLLITLDEPCELTGSGTVFPDDNGKPTVHIHGSVGKKGFSATGDLRPRMVVWLVMEVTITELRGSLPKRKASDPRLDGKLLEI